MKRSKESELIDRCRISLLSFSEYIFASKGDKFKVNWHHEELCYALEDVVAGKTKRLIINIPPRYSKTQLVVINFIAWSLGSYPDSEYIHASYSKVLATKNSYYVKQMVTSEAYRVLFPHIALMSDSKAKSEWRTTMGGVVYASGAGGTITGYGAGKMREVFGGAIIIDDPHKAGEVASEVKRDNVKEWYKTTIESRKNSKNTPIIIIMQRHHEEDLTGHLLEDGIDKWVHIKMPAISDKGVALWNYKHTLAGLAKEKARDSYVFAGQYMQSPAPKGGGIFRNDWWKYYDVEPSFTYRLITGDTAQKTGQHNDYSVFQCWGVYDNNVYLIDQIRGKWESPELRRVFIAFYNKHNAKSGVGTIRKVYIEDKVSGTGLIQDIRREQAINIAAVQRNRDKVVRARDVAPFIESGRVRLPSSSIWLSDYLSEFESFTPLLTHRHDDQVDATLDAVDRALINVRVIGGVWG